MNIDYISTKISKGIGIIARLRHLVPFTILLNIYLSLIESYISYGLVAWGQAANTYQNKFVILQKRVLRVIQFSDYKSHTVPLFVSSRILPVKLVASYIMLLISVLHPRFLIYLFAPKKFTPTQPHDSHKLGTSILKCREQISSYFPFLELVLKYGMASLLNFVSLG